MSGHGYYIGLEGKIYGDQRFGDRDAAYRMRVILTMAVEPEDVTLISAPDLDTARGMAEQWHAQCVAAKAAVVDGVAPLYPAGTPEYAAYRAELLAELEKFRKGEEPYPYG